MKQLFKILALLMPMQGFAITIINHHTYPVEVKVFDNLTCSYSKYFNATLGERTGEIIWSGSTVLLPNEKVCLEVISTHSGASTKVYNLNPSNSCVVTLESNGFMKGAHAESSYDCTL